MSTYVLFSKRTPSLHRIKNLYKGKSVAIVTTSETHESVDDSDSESEDSQDDVTWVSLRHEHNILNKYDLPDVSKKNSNISVWYSNVEGWPSLMFRC
jgi:hypothetical protein